MQSRKMKRDQTRPYSKERTKKFSPLKGIILDIDSNCVLLPTIFQNIIKNSQSQNDLRAIVNEEENLNQNFSRNCQNKTSTVF